MSDSDSDAERKQNFGPKKVLEQIHKKIDSAFVVEIVPAANNVMHNVMNLDQAHGMAREIAKQFPVASPKAAQSVIAFDNVETNWPRNLSDAAILQIVTWVFWRSSRRKDKRAVYAKNVCAVYNSMTFTNPPPKDTKDKKKKKNKDGDDGDESKEKKKGKDDKPKKHSTIGASVNLLLGLSHNCMVTVPNAKDEEASATYTVSPGRMLLMGCSDKPITITLQQGVRLHPDLPAAVLLRVPSTEFYDKERASVKATSVSGSSSKQSKIVKPAKATAEVMQSKNSVEHYIAEIKALIAKPFPASSVKREWYAGFNRTVESAEFKKRWTDCQSLRADFVKDAPDGLVKGVWETPVGLSNSAPVTWLAKIAEVWAFMSSLEELRTKINWYQLLIAIADDKIIDKPTWSDEEEALFADRWDDCFKEDVFVRFENQADLHITLQTYISGVSHGLAGMSKELSPRAAAFVEKRIRKFMPGLVSNVPRHLLIVVWFTCYFTRILATNRGLDRQFHQHDLTKLVIQMLQQYSSLFLILYYQVEWCVVSGRNLTGNPEEQKTVAKEIKNGDDDEFAVSLITTTEEKPSVVFGEDPEPVPVEKKSKRRDDASGEDNDDDDEDNSDENAKKKKKTKRESNDRHGKKKGSRYVDDEAGYDRRDRRHREDDDDSAGSLVDFVADDDEDYDEEDDDDDDDDDMVDPVTKEELRHERRKRKLDHKKSIIREHNRRKRNQRAKERLKMRGLDRVPRMNVSDMDTDDEEVLSEDEEDADDINSESDVSEEEEERRKSKKRDKKGKDKGKDREKKRQKEKEKEEKRKKKKKEESESESSSSSEASEVKEPVKKTDKGKSKHDDNKKKKKKKGKKKHKESDSEDSSSSSSSSNESASSAAERDDAKKKKKKLKPEVHNNVIHGDGMVIVGGDPVAELTQVKADLLDETLLLHLPPLPQLPVTTTSNGVVEEQKKASAPLPVVLSESARMTQVKGPEPNSDELNAFLSLLDTTSGVVQEEKVEPDEPMKVVPEPPKPEEPVKVASDPPKPEEPVKVAPEPPKTEEPKKVVPDVPKSEPKQDEQTKVAPSPPKPEPIAVEPKPTKKSKTTKKDAEKNDDASTNAHEPSAEDKKPKKPRAKKPKPEEPAVPLDQNAVIEAVKKQLQQEFEAKLAATLKNMVPSTAPVASDVPKRKKREPLSEEKKEERRKKMAEKRAGAKPEAGDDGSADGGDNPEDLQEKLMKSVEPIATKPQSPVSKPRGKKPAKIKSIDIESDDEYIGDKDDQNVLMAPVKQPIDKSAVLIEPQVILRVVSEAKDGVKKLLEEMVRNNEVMENKIDWVIKHKDRFGFVIHQFTQSRQSRRFKLMEIWANLKHKVTTPMENFVPLHRMFEPFSEEPELNLIVVSMPLPIIMAFDDIVSLWLGQEPDLKMIPEKYDGKAPRNEISTKVNGAYAVEENQTAQQFVRAFPISKGTYQDIPVYRMGTFIPVEEPNGTVTYNLYMRKCVDVYSIFMADVVYILPGSMNKQAADTMYQSFARKIRAINQAFVNRKADVLSFSIWRTKIPSEGFP